MSDKVVVALITATAPALVSVTALLLELSWFCFDRRRFCLPERRMDTMQNDLKELQDPG